MRVEKIKEAFNHYHRLISSSDYLGWQVWDDIAHVRRHWDIDELDVATMLMTSMPGKNELWSHRDYHPRDILVAFAEAYPDMVRAMFLDLFQDQKDISGRINRFLFHCDELFKLCKENPKFKFNSHYHHDRSAISFYLCIHDPNTYGLYNAGKFAQFISYVESPKPFVPHDMERFYKTCKVLKTLLQKEEALLNEVSEKIGPVDIHDFMMIIASEVYISIPHQ